MTTGTMTYRDAHSHEVPPADQTASLWWNSGAMRLTREERMQNYRHELYDLTEGDQVALLRPRLGDDTRTLRTPSPLQSSLPTIPSRPPLGSNSQDLWMKIF